MSRCFILLAVLTLLNVCYNLLLYVREDKVAPNVFGRSCNSRIANRRPVVMILNTLEFLLR